MAAVATRRRQHLQWDELEDDDLLLPPRVAIGPGDHGLRKTIDYRFDDKGAMAAAVAAMQHNIQRDELEEDDYLLLPRIAIGPDQHGKTKAIDFRFDEKGNKVTTTRSRDLARPRFSGSSIERCSWPKFGDAVKDESAHAQVCKAEEATASSDQLAMPSKEGVVPMVCNTCGKKGEHLTFKCPSKGLAPWVKTFVNGSHVADKARPICQRCKRPANRTGAGFKRPSKDEASIRVTNLSENTSEADLRDLFSPFGLVTRIYISADEKTGLRRQVGIIEFGQIQDAKEAIRWLNGYTYDELVLRVEWATPRSKEAYVPPICAICMRATANSFHVTNLSEDTCETDLLDLFCSFGLVTHVHLAADEKTGSCKQFGVVEFGQREDAEEAVSWMNGYTYDKLTLQVEGPIRPQDLGL